MAIPEVSARDLRERVTFQRRGPSAGDGAGNFEDVFADLFSRNAKLTPTRGGDTVIAGRLQGTSAWDCWVRFDKDTRTLTPDDRVIDARHPERIFNIRWAGDLTGRKRWLLLQLELGVAT